MHQQLARNRILALLTQRETEVLQLIGAGSTSKEVAVALRLSVETIGNYRKALC